MKQKGRTTKYDTIIKPKLEEIKKWSQSGATGKQIAGNLGIADNFSTVFRRYVPQLPTKSGDFLSLKSLRFLCQ